MQISRDVARRHAEKYERQAADKAKRAKGLRTVLAEIGNWTWDGQL